MAIRCSVNRRVPRSSLTLGLAVLLVAFLTSACGPAVRFDQPASAPARGSIHIVRSGETLFKIAWRYGLDHRDLARWNDLDNPSLIFPGQRLGLSPGAKPARSSTTAKAPAPGKPKPVPKALPAPSWRWPADGPIVSRFGQSGSLGSGIGIGGKAGVQVRSAAKGKVVYTGTGILGYGQLVIVKHNESYLSAYAHNRELAVGEGDEVNAGQTIARMGEGPDGRSMLHFEIRRNGIPIDPLGQLPQSR